MKNVTWESIKNWLPIVTLIVGVALTFGATITRIAVVENKQDISNRDIAEIKDDQKEILSLLREYQGDNQKISLRLNTLETIIGLK
jgi:hypothetical protein